MIQNILIEHNQRYPHMVIQDFVKLIYQNEFGGGHLISDPQKSLEHILDERTIGKTYFEDIGNEQVRLHIGNISLLEAKCINQLFILSSKQKQGTLDNFKLKLKELYNLVDELPYSLTQLNTYLEAYEKQGYPMVSHSKQYKENYTPHYRVILKKYAQYYSLILKIYEIIEKQKQITIAIDGLCGSGKTTLANILNEIFNSNLFHMDDFFLPPFKRTQERLNEAGGNVDYERFKQTVLTPLAKKETVLYQPFDCHIMQLCDIKEINYRSINIIEGTYSMHPYFEDPYDLKIFVETKASIQLERILKRNGEVMFKKFKEIWIPMENKYFKTFKIKNKCDQIIIT